MIQHSDDDGIRATLRAACHRISATRVDIAVESTWDGYRLLATYQIELESSSKGRYVLLDYSGIRFPPVEVTSSDGSVRDLGHETSERIVCVDLSDLPTCPALLKVWLTIEWRPDNEDRGKNPFLILTTAVPFVIGPEDHGKTSTQPVFFLDPGVAREFQIAGVQLDRGNWDPVRSPQLELVLLRQAGSVRSGTQEVLFAGDAASAPLKARKSVTDMLAQNLAFLGREFDFSPTVRLGVYADANPGALPLASRAMLVERPTYLGLDGDLDILAIRTMSKVSDVWWGAGIFITGYLGLAISYAIGHAVALRRLAHLGTERQFDMAKHIVDERAASSVSLESRAISRVLKLSAELGLVLFDRLSRDTEIRTMLQAMVADYWGLSVPSAMVLDRFASFGVFPPRGIYELV